jgi:adenosylhomocysteinase
VPEKIASDISRLKLKSMGIKIEVMTPAQKKCLASWEMGT